MGKWFCPENKTGAVAYARDKGKRVFAIKWLKVNNVTNFYASEGVSISLLKEEAKGNIKIREVRV
jgi:hypothetical protein